MRWRDENIYGDGPFVSARTRAGQRLILLAWRKGWAKSAGPSTNSRTPVFYGHTVTGARNDWTAEEIVALRARQFLGHCVPFSRVSAWLSTCSWRPSPFDVLNLAIEEQDKWEAGAAAEREEAERRAEIERQRRVLSAFVLRSGARSPRSKVAQLRALGIVAG